MLFLGWEAFAVLGMGECFGVWKLTLAPYIILLALILYRRPKQPTRTDLLLVARGFPLLYFTLLVVCCDLWSAHHLR